MAITTPRARRAARLFFGLLLLSPAFESVGAAQVPARPAKAAPLPGISITQKGPESAPVTIVEFSDFECPFCATIPPVMEQLSDLYPGQIRFVFKHSPLPMHPNAPLAHEAALAAGLQGRFWEMHDLLFAKQEHLSLKDLTGYARQLRLDVPAFTAALADRRLKAIVDQDLLEARAYGVNATPTFFVNGQKHIGAPTLDALKAMVETALGRGPDPDAPVGPIDVGDAPAKGAPDATVTIVEFSDLQCPFCAQAVPVMRELLAAYDGKVRWVFKQFPLSIHPAAVLVHGAALAAGEQGKFWEMHDALFADQQAVKREDLIATARKLGLDVPRFTAALDDGRFKRQIENERTQGEVLGVDATPTFFINGRRVVGVKKLEEMKVIVEQELGGLPASSAAPAGTSSGVPPAAGPDLGRGDAAAPITMLWFSDLRSALTPRAADLVQQVMAAYPGQIRVEVRHRPLLESRPESRLVHEAAVAAAAQGRFWEMHDLLLAEPAGPVERSRLVDLAKRAGLDEARFLKDLEAGTYRGNVERDLADAERRSVRGTPVFFVNGQRIDGIQPLSYFKRIVDAELQRRTEK